MANISISITGVDKLIAKLGKAEGIRVLRAPMQRALDRIEERMKQYPAKPNGSTYNRTGNLGRKWVAPPPRETGDGLVGTVGNNVKSEKGIHYAPLVQSAKFQASVHRGRWINTDEYVVETTTRTIVRDFERAISDALR